MLVLFTLVATSLRLHDVIANTDMGVYFTQLDNCSKDFAFQQHDRKAQVSSVLDCARRCAEDSTCASFNYYSMLIPGDDLNCGTISFKATNCTQLQFIYGAQHYQRVGTSNPWTLALAHANGHVVSGSISHLIDMVTNGANLRVFYRLENSYPQSLELYDVDSTRIVNETLEANVFTFSSVFSSGIGNVSHHWTSLTFSTTGSLRVAVYSEPATLFTLDTLHWFVKDTAPNCPHTTLYSPILLEVTSDGDLVRGNDGDLVDAIKGGNPIQVTLKYADNRITSFPLRIAKIAGDNITIVSSWISQNSSTGTALHFTQEMIIIQSVPEFSITTISNIDLMDMSADAEVRPETASVSFAADFCWEKIYEIDHDGLSVYGSYSDLAGRVHLGANVRIVYQCTDSPTVMAVEVDGMVETGTMLLARSPSSFTQVRVSDPVTGPGGVSDLMWWEVYTNGTVNEITLSRTTGTTSFATCRASISWFLDKAAKTRIWYRSMEDTYSLVDDNFRDEGYLYQGVMLTVVLSLEGKVYSRKLQRLQWLGTLEGNSSSTVNGFLWGYSTRSIVGQDLIVTEVTSINSLTQVSIGVGMTPNPVYTSTDKSPMWVAWYA